jgi:hypothetical protein
MISSYSANAEYPVHGKSRLQLLLWILTHLPEPVITRAFPRPLAGDDSEKNYLAVVLELRRALPPG